MDANVTDFPPTRREHADEARRMLAGLPEWLTDAAVEAAVDLRASERHAARVDFARAACDEAALRAGLAGPDGTVGPVDRAAVAALALVGQGGPRGLGGPGAASQLPLLAAPVFYWRRQIGGAWTAALREVADGLVFVVRFGADGAEILARTSAGESSLVQLDGGRLTGGWVSANLLRALARALDPRGGRLVDGSAVDVWLDESVEAGHDWKRVAIRGASLASCAPKQIASTR